MSQLNICDSSGSCEASSSEAGSGSSEAGSCEAGSCDSEDIITPRVTNVLIRNVGEVNWANSCPKRAGIILYDEKGLYLGVDSYTKELTDFGGEINYINEDTISGSIREYKEETLKTFPSLSWFDIFNAKVVLSDSIVIFLVRVYEDLTPLIKDFNKKKIGKRMLELSDILYIRREDIEKYKIYRRIQPLLSFVLENYDWM